MSFQYSKRGRPRPVHLMFEIFLKTKMPPNYFNFSIIYREFIRDFTELSRNIPEFQTDIAPSPSITSIEEELESVFYDEAGNEKLRIDNYDLVNFFFI